MIARTMLRSFMMSSRENSWWGRRDSNHGLRSLREITNHRSVVSNKKEQSDFYVCYHYTKAPRKSGQGSETRTHSLRAPDAAVYQLTLHPDELVRMVRFELTAIRVTAFSTLPVYQFPAHPHVLMIESTLKLFLLLHGESCLRKADPERVIRIGTDPSR